MLILAIDSATPTASVAISEDGRILYESYINYKKTHSETLMPMVDLALKACEKSLDDISAIAVTVGPGSFTGLRIGLAAVKALAVTKNIPVIGISTLELLAHNATSPSRLLVAPLLDARKQEVYTAFYACGGESESPVKLSDEMAISPAEFINRAKDYLSSSEYGKIVLIGDGIAPYKSFFEEELKKKIAYLPEFVTFPKASVLADLARIHINRNPAEFLNILSAKPIYLRLSEAEYRLGKGEL